MTELESDSLANSDLKSKLKQENTQLVHRYEEVPAVQCMGGGGCL